MDCHHPPITHPEPPHKTGHSHTRPPETQAGERLPDPNRAKTEKQTTPHPHKNRHHLPTKRRQTIHNKATPFMLRQQYSSPQTEECTHRRTTATERATLHKRRNILIHHEVIPDCRSRASQLSRTTKRRNDRRKSRHLLSTNQLSTTLP